MTRGLFKLPPGPGMAPTVRATRSMAPLALAVAILASATADGGAAAPRGDTLPEGNIVEVRIENLDDHYELA